jgi:hypothetical protein
MADDFDDDDFEQLFISFNTELKFVRVIGNAIYPATLALKCDVTPMEDASEAQMHAAMMKVRFWLEHIASRSIAISSSNGEALGMFVDDEGRNQTDNILMITPGEPSDEMMACLLQSKLSAITNGVVIFGVMEVKSDNQMGFGFTFVGEGARVLPSIEEWIGPRSYFKVPWWQRNDGSTIDVVPSSDADLSKTPPWAFSLDNIGMPKPETGIIVRPQFKPTVIDGGKPKA